MNQLAGMLQPKEVEIPEFFTEEKMVYEGLDVPRCSTFCDMTVFLRASWHVAPLLNPLFSSPSLLRLPS